MATELLTIGQLARRVGMRPSALRFYEAERLLLPAAHSPAGYRLYAPDAETTVRQIQRAQRLGFALADIRALLVAQAGGEAAAIERLARERFLTFERQLTPLLVLQHELGLLLRDLRTGDAPMSDPLDSLVERICRDPQVQSAEDMLATLVEQAGCALSSDEAGMLLGRLRGQHIHLWQEGDTYLTLFVGADDATAEILERLAELEAGCGERPLPELRRTDEGPLFVARGPHAFLFARLFLALEQGLDSQPDSKV